MKRTWILAGLALAGFGAPLAAQERVFAFASGRPRIGISVETRADTDNDKLGARIREVLPDGPAEKAGLKSGDIITRFNGKSLGGIKADDDDESGPGERLIELAHSLDVGDTVEVEYRRGSENRKTTLVASDLGHGDGHFRFRMPDMPRGEGDGHFNFDMPDMRGMMERMPGMPGDFDVFLGDRGGLNLTDLNPDLGDYFGTREGVLVLDAPADSSLPLKAGDVILSIDGRKPQSVAHTERILHSYDKGESVKLEIMRKQKRSTVTWVVPESRSRMKWRTGEPLHMKHPGAERS